MHCNGQDPVLIALATYPPANRSRVEEWQVVSRLTTPLWRRRKVVFSLENDSLLVSSYFGSVKLLPQNSSPAPCVEITSLNQGQLVGSNVQGIHIGCQAAVSLLLAVGAVCRC